MGFFAKSKNRNITMNDKICLIKMFKTIDQPEAIELL